MKKDSNLLNIIEPQNQLNLFSYEMLMKGFIKIFEENNFPKQLLVTAPKGSGKSTFIYHFINFILSKNEPNAYNSDDFLINSNNPSYRMVNENIHPNFFLMQNLESNKSIKIDQTKQLIKFLNKSSYSKSLKIVFIDNAELLNLNASNALLKVIEEPDDKTFFFISQDSNKPILSTIKSRCIQYKLFLNFDEKVKVFENLYYQHFKKDDAKIDLKPLLNKLHYQSPGNLLKYILFIYNNNLDFNINNHIFLKFLLNKYYKDKDSETLPFIYFFVQVFYNDLVKLGGSELNQSFYNYSNILSKFRNMETFNLDSKNIINWTQSIIENEAK